MAMQDDPTAQREAAAQVIDVETEAAARAFVRAIEGRYPVRDVYLFGSRARGTHGQDSDADLAVVLRGAKGDRSAAVIDMSGVAVEVLMDFGVLVEATPIWEGEFDQPETCSNPALVRTIRRDGWRL